jgi:hypothetical protein
MKLSRRSVLGAIGTVGVGTGAAFGSGAFTSTTANRAVEVNILGGDAYDSSTGVIEGAGDTAEDNIAAEITETVGIDVLVDITSPAVSVESRTGTSITNVDELFPQSDVGYDSLNTAYSDGSTNYVSLVANDVRVVFGGDGGNEGLPANSTVDFDELFAFGRTDTSAGPDVTFKTTNTSNDSILADLGNGSTNGDPSGGVTFSGPSSGNLLDADVATGTDNEATEELNITIGSAN